MEIKEHPKTNRKLWAYSSYISSSWILDIYDKIDVKNEKGVLLESLSINTMLERFRQNIKPFDIISAYIWDNEKHEIIEYIKELPGEEERQLKKSQEIQKIKEKIKTLQQQLKNLEG